MSRCTICHRPSEHVDPIDGSPICTACFDHFHGPARRGARIDRPRADPLDYDKIERALEDEERLRETAADQFGYPLEV